MHEERDELMESVARELRRPVTVSAAFDERVMAVVKAGPPPGRQLSLLERLVQPREFRISPLAGLALAAGLVLAAAVGTWRLAPRPHETPASSGVVAAVASDVREVRFVLVAPGASHVSLVGDFNDWDATATPLELTGSSGIWAATVILKPGRHLYAFMVDDTWVPDPLAPRAPDEDFGTPNSVLTVTESST